MLIEMQEKEEGSYNSTFARREEQKQKGVVRRSKSLLSLVSVRLISVGGIVCNGNIGLQHRRFGVTNNGC